MSEHIELRSINDNKIIESDTEYYEIRNERFSEETTISPQTPAKLNKQYDFFTQFDVKSHKKAAKKKKDKKIVSRNLMEAINSELALLESPLLENVITKIDYSEKQASYLIQTPKSKKIFQRNKTWRGDAENGWQFKTTDLNPVFPRVLENAVSKVKIIRVQYVEPVLFDDVLTEYQEYETKHSPKFLEISIRDITFSYHHDFSLEILLCVKLVDCFKEYCNIQKDITDTLKNIEINRKTRDNLKQQLLNIGSTTKENLRFDETVLKYTGKLLLYKDKYYTLLNTEKEFRHKVVSLWADIEMIRQKSGTTNTAYVMELTKTLFDDQDYEKEFTNCFETEFSDMLDRLEYEYVIKYLEYKKFKQGWNAGDTERKKVLKPKMHIDQDKLKEEVEKIVNMIVPKDKIEIFLKEDKRILRALSNNQTSSYKYNFKIYVDNVFVCESDSMTISFLFNSIKFNDTLSIQILPNNETLAIFLCEDDVKVASVIFNISEVRINSSNAYFHTEVFTYNNSVEPNARFIGSGVEIKEILAKTRVRLKTTNMFKGKLYTTAVVNIKTGWSDKLNDNRCDSVQELMHLGRQLKRLMHGNDKPHVGILKDIIEKIYETNIDNDAKIKNALEDVCNTSIHDDGTFTIDPSRHEMTRLRLLHLRNSGGFDNVVDKTIPIFPSQISTEQLTCLQKSEEDFDLQIPDSSAEVDPIDVQRFTSVKYVDKLNEKLQKSLNECLLKKTYKDVVRDFKDLSLRGIFSSRSNFELETTSSITKQRLLRECLTKEQEIKIVVLRAINLLDRSTAIISEELDDNESIAGFKVRPLRPFVRIGYHGISVRTSAAIGCHPTWNINMKIKTKKYYLPTHIFNKVALVRGRPDKSPELQVKQFLGIVFVSRLSPLSLIHVNVYDECRVDVSEAHSEDVPSTLGKAVHYSYYNKWLGTVQIPLFAILSLGSLGGTFKISSPPIIFGYDALEPREPKSVIPEVIQLMKKQASFLTLHVSTSLSHLGGFQGHTQPVPDSDSDMIITHLNTFVTDYLNEFPSRNISLTFIDTLGRNKCVSEFLQPVPLPDSKWFLKNPKMIDSAISKSSSSKSSRRKLSTASNGEDKESEGSAPENMWKGAESKGDPLLKLVNAAARYVALIPTYEISESHVVTLSGAELLKVLYGSHLDHTLLLASFYLHLGIRCWVIMGSALPRGSSSYVLVKYEQKNKVVMLSDAQKSKGFLARGDGKLFNWFVFDAASGERFELRDASCPLKTVIYVFDSENIWVNIQSSQDCESVSFNFSKSSDWQPVLDGLLLMKKLPPTSVELYSTPPDVEQLRSVLEAKVKAKVQKWRSHMKTIWNRYCGSLLRDMLPHWEYWAFNPTDPRPVPGQRLKQLMITYKMFGFPLNMVYTNAKSVISVVKSTGIHLNDDPDVEFGLAVEVYAYPNNILSVWVFLSSITRI